MLAALPIAVCLTLGAAVPLSELDLSPHPSPRALPSIEPAIDEPLAPDAEPQVNRLAVGLVSAGLAAGVLAVGTQAWWDDGLSPFSLRETGFFGRDTYAGGGDKVGHMYSAFVSVHVVTAIYEALGLRPTDAAWYAALFSGALFNGFEVIDGFTDFGFEYGDVIFNTFGIGLALAQRLVPDVNRVVGFRMAYWPSSDFLKYERTSLKFINDYSGMLYFLDVKVRGVLELAGVEPGLARFLLFGVAFTTDKYSPVKVWEERQRLFGPHIGLSFPEILRAIGEADDAIEAMADVFEIYSVPFLSIALMKDLNGRDWYLSFGVANRLEVPL